MIHIKTKEEIDTMKEGGKILAEILNELKNTAKVGMRTSELDELAVKLCKKYNVRSSFLGYNNFPASLCVSINKEVVHGVPSGKVISEGDLVKLDMGIIHKNFHTDSAITVLIGEGTEENKKLISVTQEALNVGIGQAVPGNTTGDIGNAIQKFVESHGFNVPRELIGHGIGRNLHEAPEVPNFGDPGGGVVLKAGMTIAIEPMVFIGGWKVREKGLVFVTKDGSMSAHFEHTVAITENGPEILTR